MLKNLNPDDDIKVKTREDDLGVVDGFDFLARDNLAENWNNRLDRLVSMQSEIDEEEEVKLFNFVQLR